MPNDKFHPTKARESLVPEMRQREMARRMDISYTYLQQLENNTRWESWPPHRQKDFLRELASWKKNPDAKPRKKWGRKHGCRADGSTVPNKNLIPVPHSHHEIVGIG